MQLLHECFDRVDVFVETRDETADRLGIMTVACTGHRKPRTDCLAVRVQIVRILGCAVVAFDRCQIMSDEKNAVFDTCRDHRAVLFMNDVCKL